MAVLDESTDIPITESMDQVRHSLERERRRSMNERAAFDSFAKKIRNLEPTPPPSSKPEYEQCLHPSPDTKSPHSLTAIRAYKSTVMSVPHYSEEYDETPIESVSAEFGPEMSVALFHHGDFTEQVKTSLLAQIDTSIEERNTLLNTIEDEIDSVETAYDRLLPIRDELVSIESTNFEMASFGALDAYRTQLESLSESCDEGATQRQETIQRQRSHARASTDVVDVQPYVYANMSSRYPILSLYSTLSGRVDELTAAVDAAAVELSERT